MAVYGYEIHRSAGGGPLEHVSSVKGTSYCDDDVIGGVDYEYHVLAYDMAGNRSPKSNIAEITLPDLTQAHAS